MSVEFDVNLTEKDLYRFNIYQTYHGSQGVMSILIALLMFVIGGVSGYKGSIGYLVLYLAVGIVVLIYIPVSLKLRVKQIMKTNEVLANTLHFCLTEEALLVTQGEEKGELPLDMVYKVVATKYQVLIYSNRINAYIIPREQLGGEYEPFCELIRAKLPSYRRKLGR